MSERVQAFRDWMNTTVQTIVEVTGGESRIG